MDVFLADERGEWTPNAVGSGLLVGLDEQGAVTASPASAGDAVAQFLPYRDDADKERCLLIVRPGWDVRVNGLSVVGGAATLLTRDEVRLGPSARGLCFFLLESQIEIVGFEEGPEPTFCARSKKRITQGTPAVRCPCGLWYIETEELPAYTYQGQKCVGCPRLPKLGLAWEPEPLRLQATRRHHRLRPAAASG